MTRPHDDRATSDRWHVRPVLPLRPRPPTGAGPTGTVCRTCVDWRGAHPRRLPGLRHRGSCPAAARHGTPICPACAGISTAFRCPGCGRRTARRHHLCIRCTLTDRVTALLDNGTGHIRPEPVPLAGSLHAMHAPAAGLNWLSPATTRLTARLLRGLARGEIALTHAALHDLQPWRAAAHLRDLLMACDALPGVDRRILLFEQWYLRQLAAITDPGHLRRVMWVDLRCGGADAHQGVGGDGCCGPGEQPPEGVSAVPGQSHLLGDLAEAGLDPVAPLGDDLQQDGGHAGALVLGGRDQHGGAAGGLGGSERPAVETLSPAGHGAAARPGAGRRRPRAR